MHWAGKNWFHPGLFVLACVVSVLFLLVLDFGGEVEARTWYVDDDGEMDFTAIHDAINASSDGDTIRVFEGEYTENVVVNRSITLIGNGSANTTIRGGGAGDAVRIISDRVNMSGFNVTESGGSPSAGIYVLSNHTTISGNNLSNNHYGICLNSTHNNTVRKNNATGNDWDGIFLNLSINCILEDNEFSDNYWNGIYLEKSHDNTITNNSCLYNRHGIHLRNSKRSILSKNNCSYNNFYGIILESSNDNSFSNSSCWNNKYGLYLTRSYRNSFVNITSADNDRCGVWLETDCDDNTLMDGTFSGNGKDGVYLYRDSYDNTLTNNTCSRNGERGIRVVSNTNHFEGNTCSGNIYGISIDDENTLTNNTCQDNEYGIWVGDGGDSTLLDNNTCTRNDYGIFFERDSRWNYHVLTNNTCSYNDHGIYLEENQGNSITNNTCSYNLYSGIHFEEESGYNILTNNTCEDNQYGISLNSSHEDTTLEGNTCLENVYGIMLRGGTGNTLTGNNCTNNTRYGIWLSESSFNTLTGNTCSRNAEYGIFLWSSSNDNELESNVCSGNGDGISSSSSRNNTLSQNVCQDNLDGISLHSSENTTLTGNIMRKNGVFISGDGIEYWSTHTIDSSNTVNGKPLLFLANQTGSSVPAGAGQVILANCSGVLVSDQECDNGTVGILLGYSSAVNLTTISCRYNFRYGIYLFSCENISFSDISCEENREYGIYLHSTGNCSLEDISCSLNYYGLSLRQSNDNSVMNSTLSKNNGDGILLKDSANNTFSNNSITNNKIGIRLLAPSKDNVAYENAIHDNRIYGIDASGNGGYDIDATRNWWGDESGPYHSSENQKGKGDNVTDNVEFDPWIGKPSYQPPRAIIDSVAPPQAVEGEMVAFEGHGEGSCDIIRYVWRSSIDKELYNGTSSSFSASSLSNGTHSIYFRVRDDCGGWSEEEGATVVVNGVPRARIDSITPNPAVETDNITFVGNGTDDGIITRFSWNSSLDGEFYNGTNSNFSRSNLSVGVHTIILRVMDDQGVWSPGVTGNLTVNISVPPNKRPLVTISTPANNSDVSGLVNITGTATDEDGEIEKVELSLNGSSWVVVEGGGSWWHVWNSSTVENGSYEIRVRAFDGEDYSDEIVWGLVVKNEGEAGGDGEEDGEDEDDNVFSIWVVVAVAVVASGVGVAIYRKMKKTNRNI